MEASHSEPPSTHQKNGAPARSSIAPMWAPVISDDVCDKNCVYSFVDEGVMSLVHDHLSYGVRDGQLLAPPSFLPSQKKTTSREGAKDAYSGLREGCHLPVTCSSQKFP